MALAFGGDYDDIASKYDSPWDFAKKHFVDPIANGSMAALDYIAGKPLLSQDPNWHPPCNGLNCTVYPATRKAAGAIGVVGFYVVNGQVMLLEASMAAKLRATPVTKIGGVLEGRTNFVVDDPFITGRTITDIDRIEYGVLWEEKSATGALNHNAWIDKHISGKFNSYMEARAYLPGYERAPIGFDFTKSGVDASFQSAVEARIAQLKVANPDVKIVVKWR